MKEFIKSEIRKAIGRLMVTMIFLMKSVTVVAINVVFWFAPLFLMGYLVLKLVFSSFDDKAVWSSPQLFGTTYQRTVSSQNRGINLPDILRSAEDLWRTLRNLGKV